MKVVIQRSKEAKVIINNEVYGQIDAGLVILSCFTLDDDEKDIEYIVKKILNLRIFDDENGVMNKSILEVGGSILSISQFTLYADTSKGNRPSYLKALNGSEAIKLYDLFNQKLRQSIEVKTGVFGADMQVTFTNDGPITIIIDSKEK